MAGFMDKIKKFVGSDDLEDDYDDYEEEAVVEKQPKSVGESYAKIFHESACSSCVRIRLSCRGRPCCVFF